VPCCYWGREIVLPTTVSTNDVPQVTAISYIYELPFGPRKKYLAVSGVAGKLAGGWQLTGIHQDQSGRRLL
jgi:hypothetical protein